jgi:lipopolysaccharide export system protein LptC
MPGDGNLHSRIVVWLKVGLPLAALALLSTLFLVSNRIDPSAEIPYADVDVEDRLRQPRMTAPVFSGMTADGAAITLTAAEARPPVPGDGGAERGSASDVVMRIEMTDGQTALMVADAARIDAVDDLVQLTGAVVLETSSGWRIASDALTARLDRTAVTSPGPIRADGPPGTVTAQTMSLAASGKGTKDHVLIFNGGVKLVYRPAQ